MAKNIDKKTMIIGGAAAVGVIQTVAFREYVDVNFGTIPFIGDFIPPPWNRWSTFGNIVIGGVLFGVTSFTDLIDRRSSVANDFLQIYGLTILVGGVMNGIMPKALGMRGGVRTAAMRIAPRIAPRMNMTPTGIPAVQVLS